MKKLVLMLGGQGSGKGSLSKRLLQDYNNFTYIETSALLRALPDDNPLKQIMARGEMVPDTDVCNLLESKITPNNDIILDGFPRKISQAQWIIEKFGDKFDIIAIYLNIPESLMLKRIQIRIAQGGGRADDADTAAVRRRLDTFARETMPAINWLRTTKNVQFLEIPIADAPIDVNYPVFQQTLIKNKVIN